MYQHWFLLLMIENIYFCRNPSSIRTLRSTPSNATGIMQPPLPEMGVLKQVAKEQLSMSLEKFYGKKDLVIDPDLMTPLDRIAGLTFLKERGVDKVFILEHKEILSGCDKRVYITRPEVQNMKHIAAHINSDKRAGEMYWALLFFINSWCDSINKSLILNGLTTTGVSAR